MSFGAYCLVMQRLIYWGTEVAMVVFRILEGFDQKSLVAQLRERTVRGPVLTERFQLQQVAYDSRNSFG